MGYAVDIVAPPEAPEPTRLRICRQGPSRRQPAPPSLIRVGQAAALLAGRDYVIPEDIRMFAHEILRHRILLTFEALADGVTSDQGSTRRGDGAGAMIDGMTGTENGSIAGDMTGGDAIRRKIEALAAQFADREAGVGHP